VRGASSTSPAGDLADDLEQDIPEALGSSDMRLNVLGVRAA
jgi:hypothetical protein